MMPNRIVDSDDTRLFHDFVREVQIIPNHDLREDHIRGVRSYERFDGF